MKKMIITTCAAVASLALAAGIVEETKSRPVLAGVAQVASLGEVTRKVASLGAMIGNPIVPALLLTSGQQQLVDKYGRLRADAPVTWLAYIQTPAWEVAATNLDQVAVEDMLDHAVVYPSADGPATMLLDHPGATKDADGVIHLLPGEKNPEDAYVKYTADNRYCAFASSPAMAAKALADFAELSARIKAEKESPLLRAEIVERGMTALATLYKALADVQKQAGTNDVAGIVSGIQGPRLKKLQSILESIASCAVSLDIDNSGLTLNTSVSPRPGRKAPFASDFALPEGVLDRVPASAPFFCFAGDRFSSQCPDEATFHADMAAMGDGMEALMSAAARNAEDAKYKPLLMDIGSALARLFKAFPFPGATDWTGLWLAFDEKTHPCFEGVRQSAKTAETRACSDKFNDSLVSAVEKQWPGKNLLVKGKDSLTFDLAAIVDLCAAEAGVEPGGKEAKEVANAKKKIARILGGDKLVFADRYEGDMTWALVSALGVRPAAGASPTGEARVAAALPEVAARRPVAAFGLELYSLVRDAALPIVERMSKKKDARQYKAIRAAMPPPEPNSSIAGASWADANGSYRSLLRITAGELKNFGAAFNAFTAASLVGADND